MGRNRGSKRVRAVTVHQKTQHEIEYSKTPHSMVFHRGDVGKVLEQLISDVRNVMEPFTATNLVARKKNVLKDYLSLAGALNLTHFMIFTRNDVDTNLRIGRTPKGPTLTFQLQKYCLAKDVVSSAKKTDVDKAVFRHHPLLVLNNFSGEGMHMKLMSTMFQNMFLSINVNTVKLNTIRRCVLLNYDQENKTIEFRHYIVKIVPVGISKGIKKLMKCKVPNLSKYSDISEYLAKGGNLSESEAEMDGPHNEVTLPQNVYGRGNMRASQSAIRLREIGPRLTLKLVMIEEGFCTGKVLFTAFAKRSEAELKAIRKMKEEKRAIKEARRKEQEMNIQKKARLKEEHKERSLKGIKKATQLKKEAESMMGELSKSKTKDDMEDDDDAAYYEQEVGAKPDPELFRGTKRKSQTKSRDVAKKPKKSFSKKEERKPGQHGKKNKPEQKFRVKAKVSKRPTTVSGGKRMPVLRSRKR